MELVDIKECEVTIKLDLEGLRALAWELGRARREHEFEPLPDALAAFFEAAAMAAALYSEHNDRNRASLTLARYREHIEEYGRPRRGRRRRRSPLPTVGSHRRRAPCPPLRHARRPCRWV